MKGSIGKMTKTMMILTGIELSIGLVLKRGYLGVLLGSGGAFFNLYSLWYDINRMVERNGVWRSGYFGRYALNATLMLISGLISLPDLFGAFFGLLNLKFAVYISGWREEG